MSNRVVPTNSWLSLSVNDVAFDTESVYSPGRRRRKNAVMIILKEIGEFLFPVYGTVYGPVNTDSYVDPQPIT